MSVNDSRIYGSFPYHRLDEKYDGAMSSLGFATLEAPNVAYVIAADCALFPPPLYTLPCVGATVIMELHLPCIRWGALVQLS